MMLKRVFALVLVVFTLILMAVPVFAATEGDFVYEVEEGNAVVTDYTGSGGNVVIPDTLGGYPVTAIGEEAFYECTNLESIDFPTGLQSIGEEAFYGCGNLEAVECHDNLSAIGSYAFAGCDSLSSVVLGNGLTDLPEGVFYGCDHLTAITLPTSLESIGESAFYYADFTSIVLPNSVTTISDSAFDCCRGLEDVQFSENLVTIGNGAFCSCDLSVLDIPQSVEFIGEYAFAHCNDLATVTLPETVVLDSLVFGEYLFSPVDITWRRADDSTYDGNYGDYLFQIVDGGIKLFDYFGHDAEVTVPDTVLDLPVTILSGTFVFADNMGTVHLPDTIIEIGNVTFENCTQLTAIELPESLKTIGEGAFFGCENLSSITFNQQLEEIGDYAFFDCNKLLAIKIPYSVVSIGDRAYGGCGQLKVAYLPLLVELGEDVFYGCHPDFVAYFGFIDVPEGAWYFPYIYDLVYAGIINGKSATTFVPNDTITRGEFAKILAMASGDDLSSYTGQGVFSDVSKDIWYNTYINWAYENGIVNGVGNGKFAPKANISRQEMAVMLGRYATLIAEIELPETVPAKQFLDQDQIASWALEDVTAMQQAEVIGGYKDQTFRPHNPATRAEAAKMVDVFLGLLVP